MNNPDARKSLIKQIHIVKARLGLDDDTYRDVMRQLTGHESSIECSEKELRKVVLALKFQSRRQQPEWLRHLYARSRAVLGDDYKSRLHQFCRDHLGRAPEELDDAGRKSAHAFLTQMEARQ